ncbi:hypothetical protein LguiB_033436 [Lonicera macranthoides]
MSLKSSNPSPPWQVLLLVATHLDPNTLALASCVSKTWHISMSSNHLWKPLCSAHFPSLSSLTGPAISYSRLYALGHTSVTRRNHAPPKPYLSLNNLIFFFDIRLGGSPAVTLAKPVGELSLDPNGLFKFDIEGFSEDLLVFEEFEELRVVWNVVLVGFGGVFSMMDCKGKGRVGMGGGGWFSEELPSSSCCFSGGKSGLSSDLRVRLGEVGGGKVVVEKVSVGVLSVVSWRYVCVDNALRYLQHFLVPTL